MSYDYQSGNHACDHQRLMERYIVDPVDHRTLRLKSDTTLCMGAPINGAQLVEVWIGGTLVTADDPMYGYAIEHDPNRIDQAVDAIFYKIVFNKPIRFAASLLIEVCYVTLRPFCVRCAGSGSTNDWQVGTNGQVSRVTGVSKMAQQSLKYILTSRNPFNPELCCALRTFVGHKLDASITEEGITSEVTRVLTTYKQIQSAQRTVQVLDPTEVLRDVTNVATREDPEDPTLMYVTVQVQGYGGTEPVPLNVSLQTS